MNRVDVLQREIEFFFEIEEERARGSNSCLLSPQAKAIEVLNVKMGC
jgi:hypothetical protein